MFPVTSSLLRGGVFGLSQIMLWAGCSPRSCCLLQSRVVKSGISQPVLFFSSFLLAHLDPILPSKLSTKRSCDLKLEEAISSILENWWKTYFRTCSQSKLNLILVVGLGILKFESRRPRYIISGTVLGFGFLWLNFLTLLKRFDIATCEILKPQPHNMCGATSGWVFRRIMMLDRCCEHLVSWVILCLCANFMWFYDSCILRKLCAIVGFLTGMNMWRFWVCWILKCLSLFWREKGGEADGGSFDCQVNHLLSCKKGYSLPYCQGTLAPCIIPLWNNWEKRFEIGKSLGNVFWILLAHCVDAALPESPVNMKSFAGEIMTWVGTLPQSLKVHT